MSFSDVNEVVNEISLVLKCENANSSPEIRYVTLLIEVNWLGLYNLVEELDLRAMHLRGIEITRREAVLNLRRLIISNHQTNILPVY